MTTLTELKELLDSTVVTYDGKPITDYASVYCALVQEMQGNLPSGHEVGVIGYTPRRAQEIIESAPDLWEQACAGELVL